MPLEDPVPYGPEGYAGYGQAQDGNDAADQAKKAIPLIIGLLVLAILGYFAYDYAVLSVKTASVSVKNTENEALNTATVRVYALNQKTALATFTGTKTLELRRGEYEYEVAAAGYKPGRGAFSVDDKGSAVVIELVKNIDVDLELDFPDSLVKGQTVKGTVKIKNKRPTPETIDLAFDGVFKDAVEVAFESFTVGGNSADETTVLLSVKEDAAKTKLGKDKKGSVRVKYTKIKADVSLSLIEFDASKVSVNVSRVDFGRIAAGDVQEKEVKVTNNNKDFALKEVAISLEDLRTQNNLADDVKGWISFTPESLDEVEYGGKAAQTVNVRVEVPSSASDDKVNARILFRTDYWEKAINLEFDVKGKQVALVLDGLSDKFALDKDKVSGKYEIEFDKIELYNKGDLAVQNVSVALDTTKCDSSWATLGGLIEFNSIEPGQRVSDTTLTITAPGNTPADRSQSCLLLVRYSDPFAPLERKVIQQTFEIRTQ